MYTRIAGVFGTQWSFFEDDSSGAVSWKEPSLDYNNTKNDGEMLVHYVGEYNFHIEGGAKSKNNTKIPKKKGLIGVVSKRLESDKLASD